MPRVIAALLLVASLAASAAAQRPIVKASTDQTTYIRIVDSTDGTPETGVTSATSGLDLEYVRLGAAPVDLTETDLGSTSAAHSDGGLIHVGGGNYRVDLPDAAVATGVNEVMVQGTVTGMVVIPVRHALVSYDPYDSVRLGLTSLPNAAANANGGLPILSTSGTTLSYTVSTVTTVNGLASGVITATSIAADAFTAAKFASDVTTELQTGLATASAVSGIVNKLPPGKIAGAFVQPSK